MAAGNDDVTAMLEIDARRLAAAAAEAKAVPDNARLDPARHPLQLRLMGGWPREARPAFTRLNQILAPYGYALSPLHPAPSTRAQETVRALQTELHRSEEPSGDAPFAPLLFTLDERAGDVRVFVQQLSGRSAPDFLQRHVSLHDPVDATWLEATLGEYVSCMLRSRNSKVCNQHL